MMAEYNDIIVALRVGAWIETVSITTKEGTANASHSVWVRGLKLPEGMNDTHNLLSHSVWVRGLKLPACSS